MLMGACVLIRSCYLIVTVGRAIPGSEFVVANTLAKWIKLESIAKDLAWL